MPHLQQCTEMEVVECYDGRRLWDLGGPWVEFQQSGTLLKHRAVEQSILAHHLGLSSLRQAGPHRFLNCIRPNRHRL